MDTLTLNIYIQMTFLVFIYFFNAMHISQTPKVFRVGSQNFLTYIVSPEAICTIEFLSDALVLFLQSSGGKELFDLTQQLS